MLGNLASLELSTGHPDAARPLFEEALALHRRVRNRAFEGAHACGLGLTLLALGDAATARERRNEGADILRSIGDVRELDQVRAEMRRACEEAGVAAFDEDKA
ncbi:MAG: tetratricopeptide repeat protein [Planctomycetota bacterium]